MPTIDVGGFELHYRLDGPVDAPVLVLASSLGTTLEMWDPQLPALTRYRRVLRFDHRGHGASGTPAGPYTIDDLGSDVLHLLDALDVREFGFAGVSLGGMIGMWLAARAPERLERLALCCTAPTLPPPDGWRDRARLVREQGADALVPTLIPRWFTPEFVLAQPDAVSSIAGMVSTCTPEGYAGCCDAIAALDLRNMLGDIQAPTLVIGGADDPVCPPEVQLSLQDAIAGSRLLIVPAAAHLGNLEQPDEFTNALVDHLVGGSYERGMRARRKVLGDHHVDRAIAQTTPLTASFQELITRYAWGEIWSRPVLDTRTRSRITIAMLIALGRFDELTMHLHAARRVGITDAEIAEVILQCAIYCGVPSANRAFALAQQALDGWSETPSTGG